MKVSLKISRPNLTEKIDEYFISRLNDLWKDCIVAFVHETSLHISIDTGMSLASLSPLASLVGVREAIFDLLSNTSRKHYVLFGADYKTSPIKSPALGRELGQDAFEINYGPDYLFKFHINVFQWFLHESFENYSNSKNWQAVQQGRQAFKDYFKANWQSYIDLNTVSLILRSSK